MKLSTLAASTLLLLAACSYSATGALVCTQKSKGIVDPTGLSSSQAVCSDQRGKNEKAATEAIDSVTGGQSAATIGQDARGGKELINKFLAGMNSGEQPSDDEVVNYVIAIGMLAAPGAVFLLLNYCCSFWCTCMHACCWCGPCANKCRCCKCIPSATREYTTCEAISPVIVWGVLSVAILAVSIFGLVTGTYKLVDSTTGSACTWDDTYIRFSQFMKNVKVPLADVNVNFQAAVKSMKSEVSFPPKLRQGVEDISTAFQALEASAALAKDKYTDFCGNNAGNNACNQLNRRECEKTWDGIKDAAANAKRDSKRSAEDLNDKLKKVQDDIKNSIVGEEKNVQEKISEGQGTVDDMVKQLDDMMDPSKLNLFVAADTFNSYRDVFGLVQWGWFLVAIIFSLLSVIGMKIFKENDSIDSMEEAPKNNQDLEGDVTKLSCCGRMFSRLGACSWCLMLWFGTVGALFALLVLPTTAVVADACLILPELPGKLGDITGSPEVQNVSATCWSPNGNLFQGLGIDKNVQEATEIDFSNITEAQESPQIDKAGIEKLRDALSNMKDLCKKDTDVWFKDVEKKTNDAEYKIFVAEWNFGNDTTAENIVTAGTKLVDTLKCSVEDFKNVTRCYFIKETWDETSDLFCNGLNGALSNMAAAELAMAVLAIPYAVTMLFIMRRMGGHGPLKKDGGVIKVELADNF